MRDSLAAAAVVLLVAMTACGDSGSTTTTPASAEPASGTTGAAPQPTSTIAAPATTQSPTTTSTTPPPQATNVATTTTTSTTSTTLPRFRPKDPTEDEAASYLLAAFGTLEVTDAYNADAMGVDAWGDMLREGALAACRELFAGESPAQAMWGALQTTPAAGIEASALGSDELVLALLFVNSGTSLYCPDLNPGFDTDDGAIEVANAWADLTGGEAINPDNVIGDGTWVVGTDVFPGTYRNSGSSSGCYWERLAGFSGDAADTLANGFSENQQIVTISPTDIGFTSDGCGFWHRVDS